MSSTALVLRVIGLLERLGVPYMLVGSYSSNYYGRPRSTKDADFILVVTAEQLTRIAAELGAEFKMDAQATFETVTMTTRYVIQHPATAFTIEFFLLSDDPHDRARFERRRRVEFEGSNAWLPTAEDVMVTKLRWSKGGKRAKDVEDATRVLTLCRDTLDLDYVRGWCDRHGTRDLFERLLAHTRNA